MFNYYDCLIGYDDDDDDNNNDNNNIVVTDTRTIQCMCVRACTRCRHDDCYAVARETNNIRNEKKYSTHEKLQYDFDCGKIRFRPEAVDWKFVSRKKRHRVNKRDGLPVTNNNDKQYIVYVSEIFITPLNIYHMVSCCYACIWTWFHVSVWGKPKTRNLTERDGTNITRIYSFCSFVTRWPCR